MNYFFIAFWFVMIMGSIAWYGFLIFYVGYKAVFEIAAMMKTLEDRGKQAEDTTSPKL